MTRELIYLALCAFCALGAVNNIGFMFDGDMLTLGWRDHLFAAAVASAGGWFFWMCYRNAVHERYDREKD